MRTFYKLKFQYKRIVKLLVVMVCFIKVLFDSRKLFKLNFLTDISNQVNDETINITFQTKTLKLCDIISNKLVGYQPYDLKVLDRRKKETEIEKQLAIQEIQFGGQWEPKYCKSRHHIAIIIPYRDREAHLEQFLFYMHQIFARQELSYKIYLIEPVKSIKFNRGLLFNIGFIESNNDSNNKWQCHAYHDVDLLSENDQTIYSCTEYPIHMSHQISKNNYEPLYPVYFGGVIVIPKKIYIKTNGFSNQYFGWGGEDDDYSYRIYIAGYTIMHHQNPMGRYFSLKHNQETPNQNNKKIFFDHKSHIDNDGLSSVKYRIVNVIKTSLYTKYIVYYNQTELLMEKYRNK